jgi:hypothetical protein
MSVCVYANTHAHTHAHAHTHGNVNTGSSASFARRSSEKGDKNASHASRGQHVSLEEDDRITWVEDRVCAAMMCTVEEFRIMMQNRESKTAIIAFLDDPACIKLFVHEEVDVSNNGATQHGSAAHLKKDPRKSAVSTNNGSRSEWGQRGLQDDSQDDTLRSNGANTAETLAGNKSRGDSQSSGILKFHDKKQDEVQMREKGSSSNVLSRHIRCTTDMPVNLGREDKKSRHKCLCFMKMREIRIGTTDVGEDVMLIEMSDGPLKHLLHVCRDALFPLLSLPQNKRGLTSSAVKEFAFACEEFACELEILCGKMDGSIMLPLPTSFDPESDPNVVATQREVRAQRTKLLYMRVYVCK